MRIKSTGLVGIGTDDPSAKLNIVGERYQLLNLIQDSGDLAIRLNDRGVGSAYIKVRDNTSGSLSFDTGGSERLRIKHDGSVGIGTNNPLNGLDVNQSEGRLRVNRFSHLLMQNKNDSTTDYWGISARNGGELDIGYGTDADGNGLMLIVEINLL